MEFLNNINWLNVAIVAGSIVGIILVWVVWYRISNVVFITTGHWIKGNKHRVNELADQSSKMSSLFSERTKWLHNQVLEGLFGNRIEVLNKQESDLKKYIEELLAQISQLSILYKEKISIATDKIREIWGINIGKLMARSSKLLEDNKKIEKDILDVESKYGVELKKLSEDQKKMKLSWVDKILEKLIESGKNVRKNLKSSIQSVMALWLVYFLLIIDAYFMHKALESIFSFNNIWGWIISFAAVALFLALFELLYQLLFTKDISKTPAYRILQVFLLTPIAYFFGLAMYALKDVRSEDAGIVESAIETFGLYILPLALFIVAKLIHDYSSNPDNKKDSLLVILESIVYQILIIFWSLLKPVFAISKQTSTPLMRRFKNDLDSNKRLKNRNLDEIKLIETVKIYNAKQNEENAIIKMTDKFKNEEQRERLSLGNEIESIKTKIDRINKIKDSILEQCSSACIKFINIHGN